MMTTTMTMTMSMMITMAMTVTIMVMLLSKKSHIELFCTTMIIMIALQPVSLLVRDITVRVAVHSQGGMLSTYLLCFSRRRQL